MIKAVIFDMDGMVDKGKLFSERYSEKYNIPMERLWPFFQSEEFRKCVVGRGDMKVAIRPYLVDWNWKKGVGKLIDWYKTKVDVDERVITVVGQLRKRGIVCCLATNQEKYRFDYLLKTMELDKIFDSVFVACKVGYKKPQKEFFDAMMAGLKGIKRDEIMFWDDKEKNVALAKEYGFDARQYLGFGDFEEQIHDLSHKREAL